MASCNVLSGIVMGLCAFPISVYPWMLLLWASDTTSMYLVTAIVTLVVYKVSHRLGIFLPQRSLAEAESFKDGCEVGAMVSYYMALVTIYFIFVCGFCFAMSIEMNAVGIPSYAIIAIDLFIGGTLGSVLIYDDTISINGLLRRRRGADDGTYSTYSLMSTDMFV